MRSGTVTFTVFASLLALVSAAFAEPPAGRGPERISGHDLRVRQALDSRASLQIQAPGLQRDPGSTGVTSGHGKSSISGGACSGDLGRESRLPLQSRQAGDVPSRSLHSQGEGGHGRSMSSRSTPQTSDAQRSAKSNGMIGRGKETAPGQLVKQGVSRADALLSLRLSSIDHLRDVALKNGNVRLLDRADTLEAIARRQFDQRLNGAAEPEAKRDDARLKQSIASEEQAATADPR